MNRFLELFRHETPPPAGQIYADERSALLPDVVSGSPRLVLWDRDAVVPQSGRFLLVGVATWNGYDMRLLDALEGAEHGPDVIGVFDVQECQSMDDFETRLPGIGPVLQTPAVGLWHNGKLVGTGTGHEGRKIAFAACRLDHARMVELLNPNTAPA